MPRSVPHAAPAGPPNWGRPHLPSLAIHRMADLDGIVHEDTVLGRLLLHVRSTNAEIRRARELSGESAE